MTVSASGRGLTRTRLIVRTKASAIPLLCGLSRGVVLGSSPMSRVEAAGVAGDVAAAVTQVLRQPQPMHHDLPHFDVPACCQEAGGSNRLWTGDASLW